MSSKTLLEELIEKAPKDKQKKLLELFKNNCTPKKLRGELDRQIKEGLDAT